MKVLAVLGIAAGAAAAFWAYLQPAMVAGFAYLQLLCG
jgi:hypothetical protein